MSGCWEVTAEHKDGVFEVGFGRKTELRYGFCELMHLMTDGGEEMGLGLGLGR